MAFCATLANTAFRSSWNKVAPIRVAPSKKRLELTPGTDRRYNRLACDNHGARNGVCGTSQSGKVHIHGVNNAFKVEWHLDVKDLVFLQVSPSICGCIYDHIAQGKQTFAPTSSDKAVPTRSLVPQSS